MDEHRRLTARQGSDLAPAAEGLLQAPPYSTLGLSRDEAYESWQEMQAGIYEVAPPARGSQARISLVGDLWDLGSLLITRMVLATPFSVARTPKQVRADHIDHYNVLIRTDGNSLVETGGERRIVAPGTALFTDLAEPMHMIAEPGTYLSVFIPREVLDEALPRPLVLQGLSADGASGSLLSAHIGNVVQHLARIDPSQASELTRATVAMIAAALAPTTQTREQARSVVEATVLRQMSRYVELHLTDPDLTPESICKLFSVSRATLYRLFEPFGGVAAFVRERRLVAVRDKLLSANERQPLHALAETYAFSDSAHLSTSFRKLFGHNPSETRFTSAGLDASATRQAGASESLFAHRLRSLRG